MFSEMLCDGSPLDYSPVNKDNNANSAGSILPHAAHAGLFVTQSAESFYMSITDEVKRDLFKQRIPI